MRREGWQHGTARGVKTTTTTIGPADDDDAAKTPSVVAKPTGHSKFTGKCKRARCTACDSHPVSKSRDKAKGTHKLKSCDVALNHRLFSWRVAAAAEDAVAAAAGRGAHGWSKYSGFSATGILDQLSGRDYREEEEEEEDDDECRSMGESDDDDDDALAERGDAKEEDDDVGEEEFCRVGIVWEYVDGEDWCLVHEMT